ncbi:hypothetical protein SALBM135S_03687 [Streptomyces alboniger]
MAPHIAGRGVLLDVGRVFGDARGELPDAFAITEEHLRRTAEAHGVRVGRGDIVTVRTGRFTRARREGWGEYAGGAAPGLSFTSAGWLHRTEIAAIATDTWGFEVRPNEFEHAFQPLHQVVIPHIGLLIGEMWDLDGLAEDCAADGAYAFWLAAAPAHHRRGRLPRQPDRRQVTADPNQGRLGSTRPARSSSSAAARPATPSRSCCAAPAATST